MNCELEALRIFADEDDGLLLPEEEPHDVIWTYEFSLVGFVLTRKQYNFNILKSRMASIWQPGRGVNIQEINSTEEERMVLFRFFHAKDVKWVVENGPWTFDSNMIVLHEVQRGEHPTNVELKSTEFWVQVHNLH
ncbi:hypothetical protein LINPERHAP2_LOCUS12 [Linum perenne]